MMKRSARARRSGDAYRTGKMKHIDDSIHPPKVVVPGGKRFVWVAMRNMMPQKAVAQPSKKSTVRTAGQDERLRSHT